MAYDDDECEIVARTERALDEALAPIGIRRHGHGVVALRRLGLSPESRSPAGKEKNTDDG